MPTFDIVKQSQPDKTFRVASVIGKFDLQTEKIIERFHGEIDLSGDWQIGLIVGNSGTGKTTIAKQLFPDAYITNFEYTSKAVVDDMPEHCSVDEITRAFNSVGFSSPPSWLKPYDVLSNGEKMRCDLARAILSKSEMFVFDEFTSVVDRTVAQVGSFAMQKAIRKTQKKFIAVTCHHDVLEWLLPDWVFDTNSMTFQEYGGQKKNRPELTLEIFNTTDKGIWKIFSKYHYLNYDIAPNAQKYIAFCNNKICGFISTLNFPHPHVKNIKKIHRLVILPDYQGLSLGIVILEEISKILNKDNFIASITTSSPVLIKTLSKSNKWITTRYGRVTAHNGNLGKSRGKKYQNKKARNNITATFQYIETDE